MGAKGTKAKDRYFSGDAEFHLRYHIAFCPKYGRPVLETIKDELADLFRETATELDIEILDMDIRPDSVHLFITCRPTYEPQFVINQFKSHSASVLKERHSWLKSRLPSLWTRNYWISSTGNFEPEKMETYLLGQKGK